MAQLPKTSEVIGLVKSAMDKAHEECQAGVKPTDALKSQVWKLGFDFEHVYPARSFYRRGDQAKKEATEAEAYAGKRLKERGAQYWGRTTGNGAEEHSTIKEFNYDVTWTKYDGDYTRFDLNDDVRTPQHVPSFNRLLLALECELSGGPAAHRPRWQVLFDFNKLLCSRADLRVMVWPKDEIEEGVGLLDSRLRQADGWDDGYWLISGWGRDGFEHVEYHNGERQD